MTDPMIRLKEGTRDCHIATERTELARAMGKGLLTPAQYVLQLGVYLEIHSALERAASALPRVAAVMGPDPGRAAELRSDLAHFATITHAPPLTAATERVVRSILATSEAELLGRLYVMEGSRLGGAMMYPRLREALELPESAMTYYRGWGEETMRRWGQFKARMNAALAQEWELEAAIVAARAMFGEISACFEAISAQTARRQSSTPGPSAQLG